MPFKQVHYYLCYGTMNEDTEPDVRLLWLLCFAGARNLEGGGGVFATAIATAHHIVAICVPVGRVTKIVYVGIRVWMTLCVIHATTRTTKASSIGLAPLPC